MPNRRYPLRIRRTGNNCLNHAFDRRESRQVTLDGNAVGEERDYTASRITGIAVVVMVVVSRLVPVSTRNRCLLVLAEGFVPVRPQRQDIQHQNQRNAERRRQTTRQGVGLNCGAEHGVESRRVSKSSSALDLAINTLPERSRFERLRRASKMPRGEEVKIFQYQREYQKVVFVP